MWSIRTLIHTATYWAPDGYDVYGAVQFADPVEICCRWVSKTELFTDMEGAQRVSLATVLVNEDLEVKGRLYWGELGDLDSSEADDPLTIPTCHEIRRFDKTANIQGTCFIRRTYL